MRPSLSLVLSLLPFSGLLPAQEPAPVPRAEAAATVTAPADPAAPYRKATLSGRALPADGKTLTVGGGTYAFRTGTFWEIASADGKPVGLYFAGEGSLTWKGDDPAAAPVFARNAKHVGGVDVADGNVLRAAFREATLVFTKTMAPDWPAPAAAPGKPTAGFDEARKRSDQHRFPAFELALPGAETSGARFFGAKLGPPGDVLHVFDDLFDGEETLGVSDRPSGLPMGFPDWRFVRVIAHQPIGRGRRAPPKPAARLVHLDVDVREGETPWGTLAVEETLEPTRPSAVLAFELDSDSLSQKAFKVRSTRVTSVSVDGGAAVPFSYDRGLLTVYLPAPTTPGKRLKLRFEYEAPYFDRAGGDNYWELGLAAGWYPQPLAVRTGAQHTFHAVVRTRKPFLAFASGDTVRRAEEGAFNLLETKLERPVPFVTILAGKYTVQEQTEDGVTCRIASYGLPKETSGKTLIGLFHKFRSFYGQLLGPFPWKEYTIIEINSYGFGQAPPGMMRITKEAFGVSNLNPEDFAGYFSQGINQRLAHEMAHSYFGYVVHGATEGDQWIEESFSEAASSYAIEVLKDKSEAKRLHNIWRDRAKEATKVAPISFANDLASKISTSGDDDVPRDRAFLVYWKGATVLQSMREQVGDDAFFTVLRSFLRSFEKKQAVTTDDFVGLAGFVTKKDWKPWFERVFYGTEMP